MNSSFYGCDDNKSSIYKGSVGAIRDCVAGRLVFLSDGYGSARLFDEAMIAVGTPSELSSFFLSDKDLSGVYATVIIGDPADICTVREAERKSLPILVLTSLPKKHNGKIALLDTNKASLFVDPDIDTLSRYLSSFGAHSNESYDLCAPISYIAFKNATERIKPIGALHVCSAGRRGEMRSEDELFDDYRDLCESVRPLPLTLLLCPAFPMHDNSKERFTTHLKAIFRAAVYGEMRILCGGPCALTLSGAKKCFDAIFEAKTASKSLSREQNTEIRTGILVSSPHMLLSFEKLPSFDLICLDIEKLSRSFLGISERADMSREAIDEVSQLLENVLSNSKNASKIKSMILNEKIKNSIPEKLLAFLKIEEFFIRRQ